MECPEYESWFHSSCLWTPTRCPPIQSSSDIATGVDFLLQTHQIAILRGPENQVLSCKQGPLILKVSSAPKNLSLSSPVQTLIVCAPSLHLHFKR